MNYHPAIDSRFSDPEVGKQAGRTAGRFMRSLGVAANDGREAAVAFAESQAWIDRSDVVATLTKAAVGGLELSSGTPFDAVSSDFLAALRPLSLLSRLDRARRVPLRTKLVAFGAGTQAFTPGSGKNIPISKASLDGVMVQPTTSAGISVTTNEFLQSMPAGTESALTADLAAAVGAQEDLVFFDPATTGSILDGASTAASAGTSLANVDADLRAAIDLLLASGSTLTNATWMMSATAATKLALLRGSGGAPAFPNLGPLGGEILGMPALTSETISGYLALVDESGVLLSDVALAEISLSRDTSLQMTDAPSAYPSAPVQLVSLFQAEAVAFKAILRRGWYARDGAAVYITGGNF